MEESETTAAGTSASGSISVPRVVRFAFNNFRSVGGKWYATCGTCNKELVDKVGVTTSFTKYVCLITVI